MFENTDSVLDGSFDETPDSREFIETAMAWHFNPATGSPFWLNRVRTLGFDPRRDVCSFDDLALFPDVTRELRSVSARDLIPRGYGDRPEMVGIYESGGTTGVPKRIPLLACWANRIVAWNALNMELRGDPSEVNWLALVPTGPHLFGELIRRQACLRGGIALTIDLDPRWMKKCVRENRMDEAGRYLDHLVEQAESVLAAEDAGVLVATPPLLVRMARNKKLVDLINHKVRTILWSGTHMDRDTRHILCKQIFPSVHLYGGYGSTMILGGVDERPDTPEDGSCVVDPFSPYITFSVVNPETCRTVEYGERGHLITNHISRSMLLPGNLERDTGIRVRPSPGQLGDAVADIMPVSAIDNQTVVEGVY